MLELGDAVDLGQQQSMLDVEFQVEVVCDIGDLVEEAGEAFEIFLWQTTRVVPGTLHLLLSQHTGGDGDSLRCEGIVV